MTLFQCCVSVKNMACHFHIYEAENFDILLYFHTFFKNFVKKWVKKIDVLGGGDDFGPKCQLVTLPIFVLRKIEILAKMDQK